MPMSGTDNCKFSNILTMSVPVDTENSSPPTLPIPPLEPLPVPLPGDRPTPPPPSSIPPPYTDFRASLREVYKSRFPPDSNQPRPGRSRWDEVCFQWCEQHERSRAEGESPKCSMVC